MHDGIIKIIFVSVVIGSISKCWEGKGVGPGGVVPSIRKEFSVTFNAELATKKFS